MQPRWDYVNCAGGWSDYVVFLGGTNVFDIYFEPATGWLRLVCGPPDNDHWDWVVISPDESVSLTLDGASPKWKQLLEEDKENVLAYLRVFAPDWRERKE